MNVVFVIPSFIFVSLCTGIAVSYLWEKQYERHFDELKGQVMTDKERIEDLERQLAEMTAACEAAKAKGPALDKWRILATAGHIASKEYDGARYNTFNEALWLSCMATLQAVIRNKNKFDVKIYPIDDCD